jgi:hypothetical protein
MMYERYGVCAGNVCQPWACNLVDANKAIAYWTVAPWSNFQVQPTAGNCSSTQTQSMHTPGMNVLMGDASVKLVAPSVSNATWNAAITPNSNPKDVVGPDW